MSVFLLLSMLIAKLYLVHESYRRARQQGAIEFYMRQMMHLSVQLPKTFSIVVEQYFKSKISTTVHLHSLIRITSLLLYSANGFHWVRRRCCEASVIGEVMTTLKFVLIQNTNAWDDCTMFLSVLQNVSFWCVREIRGAHANSRADIVSEMSTTGSSNFVM